MRGGNRRVAGWVLVASVSVAVIGCGTPRQPDDTTTARAQSEDGTWLRVDGAWPEQISLPAAGETECVRHSDDRGYGWRTFSARTSDFAEYDAGGENPGRDFDIEVHVPDNSSYPDGSPSPPFAMIRFSDQDARFFRLGAAVGHGATITASDADPAIAFELVGTATSIDADPVRVRATGHIRCASFVDQQ